MNSDTFSCESPGNVNRSAIAKNKGRHDDSSCTPYDVAYGDSRGEGLAQPRAHEIDLFLIAQMKHAPTSWRTLAVLLAAALVAAA